jgi:hypothetical protein
MAPTALPLPPRVSRFWIVSGSRMPPLEFTAPRPPITMLLAVISVPPSRTTCPLPASPTVRVPLTVR